MREQLLSCVEAWENIDCSQKVLQWIKFGVDIPFDTIPESFVQDNYKNNVKEQQFLDLEIATLLDHGYLIFLILLDFTVVFLQHLLHHLLVVLVPCLSLFMYTRYRHNK